MSGLNPMQIFLNLPFVCRLLRFRITALNLPFSFIKVKPASLLCSLFCKNLICDFFFWGLIISYILPSKKKVYEGHGILCKYSSVISDDFHKW